MTAGLSITNRQSPIAIGLFGGSFDPVHHGHIALARAALEQLKLDALRIIPAGQPWQRAPLHASPQHRWAMIQLAFTEDPRITLDARELARPGPTYTYDTLYALRQEFGEQAVLIWIVGSDQLHNLPCWHRVHDLFTLAHFAVAQRAGDVPLTIPESLNVPTHAASDELWRHQPAGSLIHFTMPPVNLAATQLRSMLKQGQPAADLVPAPVLHYIEQYQLYR